MARGAAYGLRVIGLTGLVTDLRGLGDDASDMHDTFITISRVMVRIARSKAPRRTGALAASIRPMRTLPNRSGIIAGSVSVPYAAPINYGWRRRNITGAHFMAHTDAAMKTIAPRLVDAGIRRIIQRRGM